MANNAPTNVTNILEEINNYYIKAKDFLNNFVSNFINYFIYYIDILVNGKYYKYYIGLLLTFVLILVYLFFYRVNPYNLLRTKDSQILVLLSGCILFSIFYFFIYRNTNNTDYSNDKRSLNERNMQDSKEYKFSTENFTNTIKNPIVNLIKSFMGLVFAVMVPVIIIILFFWACNKYENMFYATKLFLGLIIFITTLAIIAKIFKIENDADCLRESNWVKKILCILKNLIFFIPCLLTILVDEIKQDIKLTPSSVYILFIMELVLICLFFFLPVIFKFISTINKNDLLSGEGPFYLNKKKIIGTYQLLDKNYNKNRNTKYDLALFDSTTNPDFNMKGTLKKINTKFPYNYSYSISFYLYLNLQPKNTSIAYNKETELFNYGNKPIIMYDGNSRKLLIKTKTKTNEGPQLDTIYKTDNIKYQKWIYFVINYENNVIDVFMDGKLVGSKQNVPPFFNDEKVTIGENNGIHGSIKDIYYFETPRPPTNIEFLYDLTKN